MTPENQEKTINELETQLERLHALYNQYFMGIEKIEPLIPRKEVERKNQMLRKEKIRNTALRFRFQTQVQKYNTQSNYWRRVCRQIEEGTYHRDVMRAKERTRKQDEALMAADALSQLGESGGVDRGVFDLSSEMGMDLDDPFAEAREEKKLDPLATLDDPFDASRKKTSPPRDDDPDKTPVPAVTSGIHKLHEKLIDDARKPARKPVEPVERESASELESFFSRKSIPPPPPSDPSAVNAPPPPRAGRANPAPPRPRPAASPPSASKREAPTPRASASAVDEDRVKAIYRAYAAARKKTNEAGVSFEKVSTLLKKQMESKKGIKDFKVVIRGGKAVIKTVKD